jgi:NADH-quinone oxidoreductase subunit F
MKITSLQGLERLRRQGLGSLYPPGLKIGVGMATCGVATGAGEVFQALQEEAAGAGLAVTIAPVGCMGFCQQEPLVSLSREGKPTVVYSQMDPDKARRLITVLAKDGAEPPADGALCLLGADYEAVPDGSLNGVPAYHAVDFWRLQQKVVLANCGLIDPERIEEYAARDGYFALYFALSRMSPTEVIDEVTKSGLRGRGGAGFPTGIKWRAARGSAGREKFIICNADEGDPGAYMDRSVLEGDPHAVLEGMAIAAYAVGARLGVVYVRQEYPQAIVRVTRAVEQARAHGLLGHRILGSDFSFDVRISRGAGAFVCGEETSLIASVEGRMGNPRPRPPFPVVSGLWGRPTVINNVETCANVPRIILNGADWYTRMGTEKSRGTKVFSLVGRVRHTGLVEVPMGTTLRDIVFGMGGGIQGWGKFKAVQTGGPSGGCLPEKYLDLPVDYESLAAAGSIMGSGGMIVLDATTCMVDLARYFIDFLREESCGKCLPCREGLEHLSEILGRICSGEGRIEDLDLLRDLGTAIKDFSLCGLGQTAPNSVLTTLRYFEDEYRAHILDKRCPAGVCTGLVLSPCQNTCPAGVDVPSYVNLTALGKYQEAWEVILRTNPFPATCGRICSHPCEFNCRRGELDQSVAIKDIKRFVTDWAMANYEPPEPFPVTKTERMAVVGAGPAGLTCAYFLRQMGYEVKVFEAGDRAGGMLRTAVPEFRMPTEVIDWEVAHIVARGVEIQYNAPLGQYRTPESLLEEGYAAVFLGLGAQRPAFLQVEAPPGKVEGFWSGLEFLRGVRDGKEFALGDKVLVIGGGNVALDTARTAKRLGAKEVTICYRRDEADMPSTAAEVEESRAEGIQFEFRAWPQKIHSLEGRVSGASFVRSEPREHDSSGRRRFVPVASSEFMIPADTVLVSIGQTQRMDFGEGSQLRISEGGTLDVDPNNLATMVPGVFAGGDVVSGPGYVIEAIAMGRRAAVAMDKYVRGDTSRVIFEIPGARYGEERRLPPVRFSQAARARVATLAARDRTSTFREVELGLNEEQAQEEARRCLRCDLER